MLGLIIGLLGAAVGAGAIAALGRDTGAEEQGAVPTIPPNVPATTPPSVMPVTAAPQTTNDGGSVTSAPTASCPTPTKTVGSAEELQTALDSALPGDTIQLRDGTYTGAFVATVSGTDARPIHLCGGAGAVLDGDGIKKGYVLHLDGVQWWRVVGFTVRNGQKGVVADGVGNSVIQYLTVEEIGDEAIHLRSASSHNAVLNNTIRKTGLRRDKFGEGIYVGSATSNWAKYSDGRPDKSDYNLVQGNTISETGSEAIDIKEGTTGGQVIGNTMDGTGMTGADSLVDVKGNDWLISGNVALHGEEGMQTHRILEGWGMRNTFTQNTVDVDGDGNHFYIHDPDDTENVVACDNRTGSGAPIKSNVDCVP